MNNQLKKEKKTSLHLLVEPEMKDEIIKFSQNGNFENISQAGRYIIQKGLEYIKNENK
ncbi:MULTISPECIES: hypothetical protein [Staphylococcus]|uniref:hypothetical protein n=1 Tax=Staphylococcus TaxID=1279 RepID=UPI00024E4797|nr:MULTISPECIES: hypothetical protein [Staphylococcus]EHS25238.1 hypothetical protein IS88_2343 [Staphylococcus aureus subsp. aureus IS-88]EWR66264.1 hypothetical protein T969_02760 [Staphylococcus aureus FVRH6079]MBG3415775.1 regulator [Staphylococcus aureus]MCE3336776.1 regulator [Staphylococcus aureus]MDS4063022.1 regulator [Staphylococcus capitis]